MADFRFAKDERLRRRSEYLRMNAGTKLHTTHFIILFLESTQPTARLGITASKKVGNAVVRNSIRRRVREFFRQNKQLFLKGDFNIIAKKGAEALTFHTVSSELAAALGRLRHRICSHERS